MTNKNCRLVRLTEVSGATLGALLIDGSPICATLEDPWRNNIPCESCIPVGNYEIERVFSSKFGNCFSVKDVIGRSLIRIHWGNDADDTEGCILLGTNWGKPGQKPSITSSKLAFLRFMEILRDDDKANLEILSVFN